MMQDYMLDTNIFSNLLKGRLQTSDLPSDGQFWATAVQQQEIKRTSDPVLRAQLLSMFTELIVENTPVPAGFAFGVRGAGWGDGEWRLNDDLGQLLLKELDEAWENKPKHEKKRSKKENNREDASVAEAAGFRNFILLTSDLGLAAVAQKHGIKVRFISLRPLQQP